MHLGEVFGECEFLTNAPGADRKNGLRGSPDAPDNMLLNIYTELGMSFLL